jgi:hypothetical protein
MNATVFFVISNKAEPKDLFCAQDIPEAELRNRLEKVQNRVPIPRQTRNDPREKQNAVLQWFLCSLLILAGSILRADPIASSGSSDLLIEALPILQANYIDIKKLPSKEGEHLSDFIAQSGGSICLCAGETHVIPVPMVVAFLPDNIIYWRLASFTPEPGWSELVGLLDQWTCQGAAGIVLDLRSNQMPDDYAGAARVASFFIPDGTPLFTSRNASGSDHAYTSTPQGMLFRHPIVLLTDKQTIGAAEALATCLKGRGALVVGQVTMGKAAVFTEERLSSGQFLRYISARLYLPDGAELWGHPVSPDIGLTLNEQNEKNALALIEQRGVLEVIRETAGRHRLSEASLVQGENPELDDYWASHEKKSDASVLKPVLRDVALINALDSLKAIRLSQRWTESSSAIQ